MIILLSDGLSVLYKYSILLKNIAFILIALKSLDVLTLYRTFKLNEIFVT